MYEWVSSYYGDGAITEWHFSIAYFIFWVGGLLLKVSTWLYLNWLHPVHSLYVNLQADQNEAQNNEKKE